MEAGTRTDMFQHAPCTFGFLRPGAGVQLAIHQLTPSTDALVVMKVEDYRDASGFCGLGQTEAAQILGPLSDLVSSDSQGA